MYGSRQLSALPGLVVGRACQLRALLQPRTDPCDARLNLQISDRSDALRPGLFKEDLVFVQCETMSEQHKDITSTVTMLLSQARHGNEEAADELFRCVYDDLRQMARRKLEIMNAPKDVTLLVQDSCERILTRGQLDLQNRRHFFFVFSRAMHDVLVERVRSEMAHKRGGEFQRIPMMDFEADGHTMTLSVIDLKDALTDLEHKDAEAAEIVRLRFFCGLSLHDAAAAMECSYAIARRHWIYAKAWLLERMSSH